MTAGRRLPRVGLIGCGTIGTWHARILAERRDVILAGVCDSIAERAEHLGLAHGCPAFTEAAVFLSGNHLDAVVIASPEDRHVAHATMAAQAGLPMLIEKPVAPDLAGIATIAEAAKAADVSVMAGHVERFEAGSAHLKAAVAAGLCGQIASIVARRQFVARDTPRFAGLSTTLRILGVHDFDLIAWVHPEPPVEVYAAAGRGAVHAATGLDDHVVTTLRYESGAVGLVESAWTLPGAYGDVGRMHGWSPAGNNRLEVFGSEGMVSNDMGLRAQQLVVFDAAGGFRAAGLQHQPVIHAKVGGAMAAQTDAFVAMIIDGTVPPAGLGDARRAVALTAAAEASLAGGRPVACVGW